VDVGMTYLLYIFGEFMQNGKRRKFMSRELEKETLLYASSLKMSGILYDNLRLPDKNFSTLHSHPPLGSNSLLCSALTIHPYPYEDPNPLPCLSLSSKHIIKYTDVGN
jgi:hypothetical protein